MKRSTKLLGAFGAVALVVLVTMVATAAAGTYGTDFEAPNFSTTSGTPAGTVDGQDGWHSAVPGDIPALPDGYDQQVVNNDTYGGQSGGDGFGAQSLRVSNAVTEKTAEFEYQTYSAPTPNPGGQDETNKVFDATFEFISTSADYQPGLQISVSPDNGHGGRMSFVSLTDTPEGIFIRFFETDANGNFVGHDVGTYTRNEVHTIQFLIEFVPGVNADGSGNDVLRLIVDDEDIGERDHLCFTTWETFYVETEQAVPVTDSLEFRADNSAGNDDCALNGATMNGATCTVAGLAGHGYLFDNVATRTGTDGGPAPTTCGLADDGVIAPTGTTCSQYRDGLAPDLGGLLYTTKGTKINAVSPGVFFYYTKVSSEEGDSKTVRITEDPDGGTAIPINQGQVVLYDAVTCKVVKWTVTLGPEVGEATGTLPKDGDYIIGVKYNPSSLKGETAPASPPITYSFGTTLGGAPFQLESTIDLALKS
jgi:hypothetical protein